MQEANAGGETNNLEQDSSAHQDHEFSGSHGKRPLTHFETEFMQKIKGKEMLPRRDPILTKLDVARPAFGDTKIIVLEGDIESTEDHEAGKVWIAGLCMGEQVVALGKASEIDLKWTLWNL